MTGRPQQSPLLPTSCPVGCAVAQSMLYSLGYYIPPPPPHTHTQTDMRAHTFPWMCSISVAAAVRALLVYPYPTQKHTQLS